MNDAAQPAPGNERRRAGAHFRDFVGGEAAAGFALIGATGAALAVANSSFAPAYFGALHADLLGLSTLHWINDGLMAVFFLLVGLEIKRELLEGQLSTWQRRALPGFAALGGMLVPALIYVGVNAATPATLRGWAIPTATDIAFALGVLTLLGRRVPASLKIFLTALAIIDDLGAVLVIALFYTSAISLPMLAAGGATLLVLAGLAWRGVARLWPYLLLAIPLWFFVHASGIHATIAGVALAFVIPIGRAQGRRDATDPPPVRLEHGLKPWVAFLIVPIFGFANAGVSFAGLDMASLLAPVPLGVAVALFFGKQLGVFAFAQAAVALRWASPPAHASWRQFYGVALLCGIGFTMSLFIGLLAFPDAAALQDQVKYGVLGGSLLSALAGAALLLQPGSRRARPAGRGAAPGRRAVAR